MLCLSAFLFCDKILENNNLKEKRFVLAHTVRGFSLWLAGSFTLGLRQGGKAYFSPLGSQETVRSKELERRGPAIRYTFQRHNSSDLLPSPRPSLLMSLQL